MAGYSPTPQARKLGLKPGMRVALVDQPRGWTLADPPALDVTVNDTVKGMVDLTASSAPVDLVIAFIRHAEGIEAKLLALGERIYPAGALWVAWPRKAAGHVSDVTDNLIRDSVLPHGLVDVKVAAIDTDWSGLKIVWRVAERSRSGATRSTSLGWDNTALAPHTHDDQRSTTE